MAPKTKNSGVLQDQLHLIIRRMQKIQDDLRSSRQPPSLLELGKLKELGLQYGRIIGEMETCFGGKCKLDNDIPGK